MLISTFFVLQCTTSPMSLRLKRAPTAVPLTAMLTVLKAARGGTHHTNTQDKAITLKTSATLLQAGQAGGPITNTNNSRHPIFPKITWRLLYPVQGWGHHSQSSTSHSSLSSLCPSSPASDYKQ